MNEKQKILIRKFNMKLYSTYAAIGTNLLFVKGIRVLFLSGVKNISNANIVFLQSSYAFSRMIFQIPITALISKIGKRNSIILRECLSNNKFITFYF